MHRTILPLLSQPCTKPGKIGQIPPLSRAGTRGRENRGAEERVKITSLNTMLSSQLSFLPFIWIQPAGLRRCLCLCRRHQHVAMMSDCYFKCMWQADFPASLCSSLQCQDTSLYSASLALIILLFNVTNTLSNWFRYSLLKMTSNFLNL